jgi:hypothetical protein
MSAIRRTALAVAICLGVPAVWAPPAFAASALTVTPNTGLIDGQTVSISGSGFPGSTDIGFCEAIDDGTPSQSDCAGGSAQTTTSSPSGDITGQLPVRQSIFVPSLGRVVDCTREACKIGAADINNIASTVAFASLSFVRIQPDGQVRRLSDGFVFGNDVYNTDGVGEKVVHPVAPGGSWSFAVQVENDGARTDDITVNAASILTSPDVSVRYFAGWFDVTALVNGDGFTFAGVPPGGIRRLPVQFKAVAGAHIDQRSHQVVRFTSRTAPTVTDGVVVGVRVLAPS